MFILLSVLGTGKYEPTKYCYNNIVTDESKFTVLALKQIFNPEKIFVVMTERAKQTHGLELMNLPELDEISVLNGQNHDELWDLFNIIVDKIPENSELILDVTHGFRSQPIILLAIIIYLQTVKNIKIKHIFYGAFDIKDENGNAQFFELTPFLELIEWSFATKLFLENGIISPISQLLINIHQQAYNNPSEYLPKGLKQLGNNLKNLETALNAIRLKEIIEYSREVQSMINDESKAAKDAKNLNSAKPFQFLLDKIQKQIPPFYNYDFQNIDDILKLKKDAIEYYLNIGLYQQAITVARELLVTWVCKLKKYDPIKERQEAENFINTKPENNTETEEFNELVKIWINLGDTRNDINHASMRENPVNVNKIKQHIEKLCKQAIEIIPELN